MSIAEGWGGDRELGWNDGVAHGKALAAAEIERLKECMRTAIAAGDWKVDGACDPDLPPPPEGK